MKLSSRSLKGFKAAIAYNLFGYYLAAETFTEPERTQTLALFEAHKEWLLAINDQWFQSMIKRLLLHTLGVKNTARFFELAEAIGLGDFEKNPPVEPVDSFIKSVFAGDGVYPR